VHMSIKIFVIRKWRTIRDACSIWCQYDVLKYGLELGFSALAMISGLFPFSSMAFQVNEEPAWKLLQKVALMHNSVKNNECDVTYVLKEPRHRSKCVIHKAWCFPLLCRRRRHHRVVYERRVSD
jgi:hypothetical protein